MNIPNVLTIFRICLVPVIVAALLIPFNGKELVAFSLFLLAVLTDAFDGILARKKKQETVFGQLLDPIADKLLIVSIFICLVELGAVPAWMVVIIIGREIAITGFRAIASSKGIHIPASRLGKFKMTMETIVLCILILGEQYLGQFYISSQIGLWVVIAVALGSAAEYCIKFGPAVFSKHS